MVEDWSQRVRKDLEEIQNTNIESEGKDLPYFLNIRDCKFIPYEGQCVISFLVSLDDDVEQVGEKTILLRAATSRIVIFTIDVSINERPGTTIPEPSMSYPFFEPKVTLTCGAGYFSAACDITNGVFFKIDNPEWRSSFTIRDVAVSVASKIRRSIRSGNLCLLVDREQDKVHIKGKNPTQISFMDKILRLRNLRGKKANELKEMEEKEIDAESVSTKAEDYENRKKLDEIRDILMKQSVKDKINKKLPDATDSFDELSDDEVLEINVAMTSIMEELDLNTICEENEEDAKSVCAKNVIISDFPEESLSLTISDSNDNSSENYINVKNKDTQQINGIDDMKDTKVKHSPKTLFNDPFEIIYLSAKTKQVSIDKTAKNGTRICNKANETNEIKITTSTRSTDENQAPKKSLSDPFESIYLAAKSKQSSRKKTTSDVMPAKDAPTIGTRVTGKYSMNSNEQNGNIALGDVINLDEHPYNKARGYFSCDLIKRTNFVKSQVAAEEVKKNYWKILKSRRSLIFEDTFIVVMEDKLMEIKRPKDTLLLGNKAKVTAIFELLSIVKIEFSTRLGSLLLSFKESPTEVIEYSTPNCVEAARLLTLVMKEKGVDGTHRTPDMEEARKLGLRLCKEISEKQASLGNEPTLTEVREIIDLHYIASDKLVYGRDDRYLQVIAHMNKFLSKPKILRVSMPKNGPSNKPQSSSIDIFIKHNESTQSDISSFSSSGSTSMSIGSQNNQPSCSRDEIPDTFSGENNENSVIVEMKKSTKQAKQLETPLENNTKRLPFQLRVQ